MDYETEEQQVEALKEWWKQNGNSVLLGLAIGVAIIVSWNAYGSYQTKIALDASNAYESVMQAMDDDKDEEVDKIATSLRNDHDDSSFAAMASLIDAKVHIKNNQLDQALTKLQWVIENSDFEELKVVAQVRAARVLLALDKADDAFDALPSVAPMGFTGLVSEVRGDIYLKKGELEKARVAYQTAQSSADSVANPTLLGMKLDDLKLPALTDSDKDAG